MITNILETVFTWIVNVFLKVLIIKKRDETIWLFGSWNGENYSDNSRYLFEYVNVNMPQIKAVWITKNQDIKKTLSNENKKCLLSNEPAALRLRLNAKYVFFTNGINDIGHYDLCHGAVKIALWHGMPLKRLYFATNNLRKRNKNIIRFCQYIIVKLYNKAQRDITIATSEKTKELLTQSFEVQPDSVYITGQPRNDVLFDISVVRKVKQKLNHKPEEKFVLYMPTWRQFGKYEGFLDNIVTGLNNDNSFLNSLIDNNVKLYIKPHPRVTIKSGSNKNIIMLGSISDIDPQELIASADMLITDYSSVFIDFALLERPLHFFVPDLDNYKNDKNGIFLSFNDFSDFWVTDLEILKSAILNEKPYYEYGIKNCIKVNSVYNDPNLEKGNYSKTVVQSLRNNAENNSQLWNLISG